MGVCCSALWRECDIRNLGLKYHDPGAFTESQALPLPLFILYRFFLACLFCAGLAYIGLWHPTFYILLHFNYWNLTFVTLYFVIGALVSLWHITAGDPKSKGTKGLPSSQGHDYTFLGGPVDTSCALKPGEHDNDTEGSRLNILSWHHEVLWFLHTLAIDTTFVVLVAYFSFWFKIRYTLDGVLDIPRHVLPFCLMVLDMFVCGIPVRIIHVIYANIFGAAYVVFSLIIIITEVPDLSGTPRIFPSLEFGNRSVMFTAWLSIFILVGFTVAQILFYLLYKIRSSLSSK